VQQATTEPLATFQVSIVLQQATVAHDTFVPALPNNNDDLHVLNQQGS
jgi:hypothetical protein